MLCLAQDVNDTIETGDLGDALHQVADLMVSPHRPSKGYQDAAVRAIYHRALSATKPDLTTLLRVVARTSEEAVRRRRQVRIIAQFRAKIMEMEPGEVDLSLLQPTT